jgi:hypothetical protein
MAALKFLTAMKAFALDILPRIISPEVGGCAEAGTCAGRVVCPDMIAMKLNKTSKNEVQNLLTFSGISVLLNDLNFP